mmetsp:Transcript_65339/g.149679  ORF Transcript_65339/g.149679 Transcript_65339/m.149679 type:complete len:224 (+) Transcript_65339:606-1277(+)
MLCSSRASCSFEKYHKQGARLKKKMRKKPGDWAQQSQTRNAISLGVSPNGVFPTIMRRKGGEKPRQTANIMMAVIIRAPSFGVRSKDLKTRLRATTVAGILPRLARAVISRFRERKKVASISPSSICSACLPGSTRWTSEFVAFLCIASMSAAESSCDNFLCFSSSSSSSSCESTDFNRQQWSSLLSVNSFWPSAPVGEITFPVSGSSDVYTSESSSRQYSHI